MHVYRIYRANSFASRFKFVEIGEKLFDGQRFIVEKVGKKESQRSGREREEGQARQKCGRISWADVCIICACHVGHVPRENGPNIRTMGSRNLSCFHGDHRLASQGFECAQPRVTNPRRMKVNTPRGTRTGLTQAVRRVFSYVPSSSEGAEN